MAHGIRRAGIPKRIPSVLNARSPLLSLLKQLFFQFSARQTDSSEGEERYRIKVRDEPDASSYSFHTALLEHYVGQREQKNMKKATFVFLGTPEFGATVLERLISRSLAPSLVLTVPDKVIGRGKKLTPSAVKLKAREWNLPVLEVSEWTDEVVSRVKAEKPDLLVLASFGLIVPESVLNIPAKGALNVHPSLLPKFRGASPIQTAILEGEMATGVTLLLMDSEVDHGPIVEARSVPLLKEDAPVLRGRLAELGADMLAETIPLFLEGEIQPREQDHAKATFTKRLSRKDGRIDWKRDAEYIERQIRAFRPWPGTFTQLQGKGVKILRGTAKELPQSQASLPPGTIIPSQDAFGVVAGKGMLQVQELQMEGRSPVGAKDLLLGRKDILGSSFT